MNLAGLGPASVWFVIAGEAFCTPMSPSFRWRRCFADARSVAVNRAMGDEDAETVPSLSPPGNAA